MFKRNRLYLSKGGIKRTAMKKSIFTIIKIRAGLMKSPGFEAPAALRAPA